MVTKSAAKKAPRRSPVGKARESAKAAAATAAKLGRDVAETIGGGAMRTAGEVSELVGEAAQNTLAYNPLLGVRRGDVVAGARSLLKAVAVSPRKATKHFGAYLGELRAVVSGQSTAAPDPKDRRFADPAWKGNFVYRRLMQSYVATQKGLSDYIDTTDLDARDKARAQFFASLVTDALAPSNWLLANPAAVRKIVDTGGENLVAGLKNLVHDIRYNNMLPSQVDTTPFKVGENMATSPGQVVHRAEMFELIQYTPSTPQVHARPLVMSPPQVNKFYAVDLSPEKSLIKWIVDSGVQMFVVSWRNPPPEKGHWSLDDYVMALDEAVEVARQITKSPDVNMWGSCSGGMTLAAYLGWLAATGQNDKVANTSWAVCVLDMQSGLQDTTLGLFNSTAAIRAAKARSRRKGYVSGDEMASMFAWLRPNDLIWNYWVNNYLLGNKPPAFDILAWNNDTTRLPGQFHCDLLDMMEHNPYLNPGTMTIAGEPIDLSQVKVGAYVIGGITDHITPWRACYGTARLFGPETTFVLANAGHLQSLINPPGAPKAFFYTAPASAASPDEWLQATQDAKQEGSWWPHWRTWIQARSGALVTAPKKLGSRKHAPLEAAPGSYVHEK
ncbi:MAG: alpha/beta fold hydrolase [Burkholderiaceae bacterium]